MNKKIHNVFGEKYSRYYDILYSSDKDYIKECNFLQKVFKKFSSKGIKSILDLACGTGKHSSELAKRGYTVDGIDLSENMIRIARKNSLKNKISVNYSVSSMQNLNSSKKFDAVICMFAAFDYLTSLKNIRKTLKNVKEVLNPGGLFVFDFWNEKKFANCFEKVRIKDIQDKNMRILRISESEHHPLKKEIHVYLKNLILKNNRLIDEFSEVHRMRYWDVKEIKNILTDSGFEILKVCSFLDLDSEKTDESWTLNLIALQE